MTMTPGRPEAEVTTERRRLPKFFYSVLENVLAEFLAKVVLAALLLGASGAAGLLVLIWVKTHLSLTWRIVLVAASLSLVIGLGTATIGVLRLRYRTRRLQLYNVTELEDQLAQAAYAQEFLRGLLETLQEMFAVDEVFEYDEFAEGAVLDPARGFLARAPGEEVRLSVLVPDGDDFKMRWAAGHRPLSKANFRIRINDSFAGRAFHLRETQRCPDVTKEPTFTPHPKATRPYKTIVSTPVKMGDEVAGALNAISTYADVFTEADVLFIELIATVVSLLLALEHDDERS